MLSQLAPPAKSQASKMQRPVAKGPPGGAKREDQGIPQIGQPPAKQIYLPQGSSSSDWQPPYDPGTEPTAKLGVLPNCRWGVAGGMGT